MLDLFANEISLPDNQKFYIVKINKDDVNEYVKKEYNIWHNYLAYKLIIRFKNSTNSE